MGGGICFDEARCELLRGNLVGLGDDPVAWFESVTRLNGGLFYRDASENPFRDASFIVLPHCTWCPRCESEGLHTAFATLHELYPDLRSSLICTYDDVVVKSLYTLIATFRVPSASFRRHELVDYVS